MAELVAQRCHVHLNREAAARCPECRQFYCRECVTEHDDVVICTACLKSQTEISEEKKLQIRGLFRFVSGVMGFVFCWVIFIWVGQMLLAAPSEFHDADLWQRGFFDH
ncbi:MAG: rhomboid family protein [Verrucomicrobiales bacterium]|nr:rhomboid family protein [Verrucomicrobiales bacterium]